MKTSAIKHCRTDRTPADYGAHKEVTNRLIERLGLADFEELLCVLKIAMRRILFDYRQPD